MSTKYTAESLSVCRLADVAHLMNNLEAQRADLLAALIQIRDMDYVPQFAERVAELARAAIEACEVQS